MSKSKCKPIETDPFTNNSGHTFNPGDPAIAVTKGWGSANLRIGKYLGVRYYPSYWNKEKYPKGAPCVVMEVVKSSKKLVHKETGVDYDHKAENALSYPKYPTARYNTPEFTAQYDEYKAAVAARGEKIAEMRKDYEYRDYNYLSRTMLQLNKIYPADIALRDVVL